MSKGQYQNKKHNRGTKTLVMLLALVLTLGCVIGGTVAWLTAQTTEVTNTFTVGDITINLEEHPLDNKGELDTDADPVKAVTYSAFVPGQTMDKDPFVTVDANSEKCWLFVEVTEENNTLDGLSGKVIDWSFDLSNGGGWTQLDTQNVVYRVVDKSTAPQVFYVLNKNEVTANANITETQAETIEGALPKIILNAYAVQYDYLKNGDADVTTAAAAWAMAKPTT